MMPHSTTVSFADPYEYQAAVRGSDIKIFPTAPGDYHAELTLIDLHRLWMASGRASLPQVAHIKVAFSRNPIFFLADAQQKSIRHGGIDFSSDDIMLTPSGSENHQSAPAGAGWRTMSLTSEDYAAVGRAISGSELIVPTETTRIRPPPYLLTRLRSLHQAACQLAANAPDVLANPEVARLLEQELERAMVGCLTDSTGAAIHAASHPRRPVMRRFEEYLDGNQDRPLHLAEVCAAIGVAERTLHIHCVDNLRMPPHRYLLLRRMNLARRALAQADPKATTVTQIATEFGFWELGRFAVTYRQLFGEVPSVTLHRV
jgi:AraC-like DNA-binding protein